MFARIFLSPQETRLRAGWRILAHFLLLSILGALAAALLARAALLAPQFGFLAGQAAYLVAITLATYLARRWFDRRSFTSLGLVWNRQAALDLLVGMLLSGLQMGLVFGIEWVFGWLSIEQFAWSFSHPGAILGQLGQLFLVFILVGWQEELLSRGYWLQNLEAGLKLPLALIVSSVLFALGHLFNPNVSFLAILGLIAAGLFLAYGYVSTRQLWLAIGLHIGWNFFEGPVFGFPVSGIDGFFHLLELNRSGPILLTGGPFGPEAGLIQYPILLLSAWIIQRYSRGRIKPRQP